MNNYRFEQAQLITVDLIKPEIDFRFGSDSSHCYTFTLFVLGFIIGILGI